MLATALVRTCSTRVLTRGAKSVQPTATRSFASGSARRRARHRIVNPPPPPPPYYNRMYGPHPYNYYRYYDSPWSFGRFLWFGLGTALIVRVASGGDCSCSKERVCPHVCPSSSELRVSSLLHSGLPICNIKTQKRERANSGAPDDYD
jgi:hypothetical protein